MKQAMAETSLRRLRAFHRVGGIAMATESNRPYWWQFFFLGLGMVAYTICRTGFPVGLAAMGREFQWTAFEVGVLSTVFLLGQAVIDIPAGFWADRLDRKRVIFVGLFGLGLFTALVTLSTGFWSALVFRVLFGIMEGVYNIAQFAVAGSILPGNRALVNGITQMFYGAGNYGGQRLVGTILGAYPGYWQLAMWWLGGLSMVYAIISVALFQRKYLRRYETQNEMTRYGFWRTLGLVVRNPRVWKAIAIHACNTIPNWAILGLGNYIFIQYRHYDPAFSAQVFGIGFGVGGLFCPLGTVWADRIGRRPVVCAFGLWTALAVFLLFYAAPPNWIMIGLSICTAFGINSLYALGYTITQDAVASASMSGIGIATGMAGGFGYVFAMLAGPLVGALIPVLGPLWAMNVVVIGCELLVAVFAFWFLKHETRPQAHPVIAR
jgi:MFS family permease